MSQLTLEQAAQAVADSLPAPASLISPDRRWLYCNEPFAERFGKSPHEMRGLLVRDAYGEHFGALAGPLERALGGEPQRVTATLPHARLGPGAVEVRYCPHRDPSGRVVGVVSLHVDAFAQAERERMAAREAEERYRFLADAGELLASSLQVDATLAALLELSVPHLADAAGVHLRTEGGGLVQAAVAARDSGMAEQLRVLEEQFPTSGEEEDGVARVLRTGQPLLVAEVPDSMFASTARDERHAGLLRALGLRSLAIAPLNARGRTLGALWFASGPDGRTYGPGDMELLVRLAERAAVAVDNARLFEAARRPVAP